MSLGKISNVRFGEVIDTFDECGADRISVRILPEDGEVSTKYKKVDAVPLLPKMFFVKPKVGEGVFVLFSTSNDGNSQRHYIGPVISQFHRIYYDAAFEGGDSYQRGGAKDYDVNPYEMKDAVGAFPNSSDIGIMGRKNCDIIIKDDDIRIRAGVKLSDEESKYRIVFNKKNPAYIKLKYHTDPLAGDNHSTATIVADKINLLSNNSSEVSVETTDTEDLITDKTINEVLQDCYRLPYGEKLVELLKKMIKIFCEHTHDYACLPPNAAFITAMKEAGREPLDQERLLSDTLRIN